MSAAANDATVPAADHLVELRCLCPEHAVEALSEMLMVLQAQSVSVEDADRDTPHEQALYGEPDILQQDHHATEEPAWSAINAWATSRLSALFFDEAAAQEAMAALQPFCNAQAPAVRDWQIVPVPAQDWVRLTQAQFEPIYITPTFAIVPSWHDGPEHAHAQRMILDPGLAFGTGSHPTTGMCLKWLCAQNDLSASSVLDYGCGSGILAIAAHMLGAKTITAVDIDPTAVQTTRDNARCNQVPDAALKVGLPEAAVLGTARYDLVLANILAGPLKILAPSLCDRLAAGGQLVMAGILERQVAEIIAAYAPWLVVRVLDQREAWVLLGGRRA